MNNIKAEDNRTKRRKTGDLGEDIACRYLVNQGYKIIHRNYLKKYGEIDIVAIKGKAWHFFEVKSVKNVIHETLDKYNPEDNVHPRKIKRLRRVVQAYLLSSGGIEQTWYFSVIAVFLNYKTRKARIRILDDIVL